MQKVGVMDTPGPGGSVQQPRGVRRQAVVSLVGMKDEEVAEPES